MAGGIRELVKRASFVSPGMKSVVLRFVMYPTVATANIGNVSLMRLSEVTQGISVTDEQGNHLANSTEAAKKGQNPLLGYSFTSRPHP